MFLDGARNFCPLINTTTHRASNSKEDKKKLKVKNRMKVDVDGAGQQKYIFSTFYTLYLTCHAAALPTLHSSILAWWNTGEQRLFIFGFIFTVKYKWSLLAIVNYTVHPKNHRFVSYERSFRGIKFRGIKFRDFSVIFYYLKVSLPCHTEVVLLFSSAVLKRVRFALKLPKTG